MELLRSLIFVPGNRVEMLEKSRQFDADVLVADLEDSVPDGEKENACRIVKELAPTLSQRGQKLVVRVNSLDTGLPHAEIDALAGPHLYGISIGKASSAWDIGEFHKIASAVEKITGLDDGHLKFIPWIENAKAIMGALGLASSSPRIVAVAFGAEDYTDDMGVRRTDTGEEVYFARATVAVAAKAAGVVALDGPFAGFRDPDALRADAKLALKLGFKGKFAIHPGQLDIINNTFTPDAAEVDYARRVVQAWEVAAFSGKGSTSLDGNMIDVPVVKRARALLELSGSITQRG